MTLVPGQEFTITGEDVPGDQHEVSVNYPGLAGDVQPARDCWWTTGGWCSTRPRSRGRASAPRVVVGGHVSDHKGLNLPGVRVSVPALTGKDADTCAERSASPRSARGARFLRRVRP